MMYNNSYYNSGKNIKVPKVWEATESQTLEVKLVAEETGTYNIYAFTTSYNFGSSITVNGTMIKNVHDSSEWNQFFGGSAEATFMKAENYPLRDGDIVRALVNKPAVDVNYAHATLLLIKIG